MARRVSGRPTAAVEANTRKLVQRPSSRPPPKAVLLMAEMVGIGRVDRRVKVLLSLVKNWATLLVLHQHTDTRCAIDSIISYSSGDMPKRSFKSAPAQKALSHSLAKIKARVLPLPPSACKPSTTPFSSLNSFFEMALRALGRSSDRTVMVPECGAGILEILRADLSADAYERCCCCCCCCWQTAAFSHCLLAATTTLRRETRPNIVASGEMEISQVSSSYTCTGRLEVETAND